MSTVDLLTVATVDYIPQAVTTLTSARRTGRYASYYLFALDAPASSVEHLREILRQDASWIEVFGPNDLSVSDRELFLSAFKYYNAFELSCFAKYVAVAHVLRRSSAAEMCAYSDADILFLDSTAEQCAEIGSGVVLLTPHHLGPSTSKNEHDYLLNGWINAGFFCFRRDPRALPILAWLLDRISQRGFHAVQYGLFVDQAWLSALPFAFRDLTTVSQNPVLNVAYWNLDERHLGITDDLVTVNGTRLPFFHFSGYDPANPERLSKHSELRVLDSSAVNGLCNRYKAELAQTEWLRVKVTGLERIPSSRKSLHDRISDGPSPHILKWTQSPRLGPFARLGKKLDGWFGGVHRW